MRSLAWRAPLVAAAGLTVQVLADLAGLPQTGLLALVVAALMGWRLRFRPSEQVTAWRRGAAGERRTARLLDRLTGDGYVVFHDLAMPGDTGANTGAVGYSKWRNSFFRDLLRSAWRGRR
jgi:hypothetical protein